jgi:uncharacterized Tic20 family protein
MTEALEPTPAVPPPPPTAPPPDDGLIPRDDRQLAMVTHLLALANYFAFPAGIIAVLVMWLVKKDESPALDRVGREVLNFNLSMLIYAIGSFILVFVLIGIGLLIALWVFGLVVTIIAAIRANDGHYYRYPLTIRFL